MRSRLTYSNVVSTIALFLVLAGGVAYAAKVAKRSVGAPQLKAGAVRTAKIKANAVTTRKIKRNAVSNAKIKDGAVETEKIADGGVTGADIALETTPFGRVLQRARGSEIVSLDSSPHAYFLADSVYTQQPTETDSFVGALDIRFAASCEAPRSVEAVLAIDAEDPLAPAPEDVVAAGELADSKGGAMTGRVELSPKATRFEPGAARRHALTIVATGTCASGSGVSATSGAADVIGAE